MSKKFDIYKDELVDILIKRAQGLKTVNWYLILETQNAIDKVEEVLNEYKERVRKYQEEHPFEKK